MLSIRLVWSVIFLVFVSMLLLIFGTGCAQDGHYDGPTIGTVGVGGSYTDKEGDTYGGNVNVGLNYPTPTPKPVDHGK